MKTGIKNDTDFSRMSACIRLWVIGCICFLASFSFKQQAEAQTFSDVESQFVCADASIVSVPEACSNEYILKLLNSSGRFQNASSELQDSFEASAPEKVFFSPDGFAINDAARQSLATQLAWLRQNPDAIAILIGHTKAMDSTGNIESVAMRRAQAIETYFTQNGVDPTRITTVIARDTYTVGNNSNGEEKLYQSVTIQVNGFVESVSPPAAPTFTCWDGSVVYNRSDCAASPVVETITCWDGSLVYDLVDCPAAPQLPTVGGNHIADPKCLSEDKCTRVDVLFGTTRKIDWNISPEVEGNPLEDISAFTEDLKDNPSVLDLGVMKVTVPHNANTNNLKILRPRAERNYIIFKRRAEVLDSSQHYTLYDYEQLDEQTFKESLSQKDGAFIYVHGFKEDAEVAAFKAAQIAVKGFYEGVPSIFTWPSLEDNSPAEYNRARKNARASAKALSEYITLVADSVQSDQVHIIAHSMGNHVLLEAMSDLATSLHDGISLGEIMLAAPDISTLSYLEFVSENKDHFGGITLYASGADKTLEVSQQVCRLRRLTLEEKGGLTIEEQAELSSLSCGTRAGHSKASSGFPLITPGADTIDASEIGESRAFLNVASWHSYPFTDSKVLSDMAAIMDPQRRAPTYRRTNLECRLKDGTRCQNSVTPPTDHYFAILD